MKFIKNASFYHKRFVTKFFSPNGKIHRSFHIHFGKYCFTISL